MRFSRFLLLIMAAGVCHATPSWVLALPEGQWQQLTTVNEPGGVADAVCNLGGLFGAWNSGDYVPTYGDYGSLFYYGGGHNDNWCSAVLTLDLATLTWEQFKPSYPGPVNPPFPLGAFPDGSPQPPHTYDGVLYIPTTDEYCTLNAERDSLDESDRVPEAYCISVQTRAWRHALSHNGQRYGGCVWNSTREEVWFWPTSTCGGVCSTGGIQRWNPETGDYQDYGWEYQSGIGVGLDCGAAYNPADQVIGTVNFRGATDYISELTVEGANRSANKFDAVTCINKPPQLSGQNMFEWCDPCGGWLSTNTLDGADVWKITRTGPQEWTWENLTDAASGAPAASSIGPYGKFQPVDFGDAVAIVGTLGPAYGVWAFRVPDAALTGSTASGAPNRKGRPALVVSPNPFNPTASIRLLGGEFQAAGSNKAILKILYISGRLIYHTAVDGDRLHAGITWNAVREPSGIYILHVEINGKALTKRLLLQK